MTSRFWSVQLFSTLQSAKMKEYHMAMWSTDVLELKMLELHPIFLYFCKDV